MGWGRVAPRLLGVVFAEASGFVRSSGRRVSEAGRMAEIGAGEAGLEYLIII
jgi:hypothetical protein